MTSASVSSGKKLAVALGIGLFTLLGALAEAQAQYGAPPPYYPPPAPRGVYRSGLVLGGSLGAGSIHADNCGVVCGAAFMGEVHIGGMVNPRVAVMGDFWMGARGWSDAIGDGSAFHGIYTLAAQYWATDILWLKGGLGMGNMQLSDAYSGTFGDETGFALMGAIGLELMQTYNSTLDLQLRVGHAFYTEGGDVDNLALMIGFNWY